MDTITFDKLLLKTAFCCMAADGHIDKREVELIKSLCEKSPLFEGFNFQKEINTLLKKINTRGKEFITYYFNLLQTSTLTESEELAIVDFTIQIINADEEVQYPEIKFFKNIRHRLKISDEKILDKYPDMEPFLEDDIVTESFLDKITSDYLDSTELPQFEFIDDNQTAPDN